MPTVPIAYLHDRPDPGGANRAKTRFGSSNAERVGQHGAVSEPAVFPRKLRRGDTVRVVAPSRSRALVLEHDHTGIIEERFEALGLHVTFGDHVDERDVFDSSSIASRVADLHAAFADPGVAAILTVIGGFNSNELLPYLD